MIWSDGSIRVLHVDDDAGIADLSATMLEDYGSRFSVETATSVREGLDLLADGEFDCVVSDYDMPGTDGFEFLDTVRETYGDLPFVLFTGKGSEEIASEAIARGVTDYLQKDTSTEQYELLANRIETAVERNRATRQALEYDRIYGAVRRTSRVLVRDGSCEEIKRRICEVITDGEPYCLAWIGDYHPDSRTVVPRVAAGTSHGDIDAIEVPVDEPETDRGPIARAVDTRQLAVSRGGDGSDIDSPTSTGEGDPDYRTWAAIPLVRDGVLQGILAVHADRPDAFDERETALLGELGHDIGHALARARENTHSRRHGRIIENVPVGVFRATSGVDGEIVDANAALADTLAARSVRALRRRAVSDFCHDSAEYQRLCRRLAERGSVHDAELRLETTDGDPIRVSVTAFRTVEDDGDYIDGIVREVTRSEESTRQRRQRKWLRTLFEQSPDSVVVHDADGNITEVNRRTLEALGYRREDLLSMNVADIVAGSSRDELLDLWSTTSVGSTTKVEGEYRRNDGSTFPVEVWISSVSLDGEQRFIALGRDISDRKQREQRLHRFRNAVEHAGHVVLITDSDGRIEYVNDAFESATGYAKDEVMGKTPGILQSGEHDEAFYRELWETILDGEVWEGEVINERKDGQQYVIDQTIAPLTADGETTGFVAINRDITDRKERELNLTFLKQAIDQAGIGIGTYDADGYPTYVNYRLAEVFGTDREALRETHMAELDPALDRDRFENFWNSFGDNERRIYDTRVEQISTGETIPVETVTSRVRIDDDPYQVVTVRDVTSRAERERELEQFQNAVEHAGHGVLITDSDGTIEYVNDAFEEMSGYTAAEVIGETPEILQSGEHDEAFYRELWETILDGEVWEGEVINERKDGQQYVIDQTIAPLTADGETTGFVAINQDITDLKEYERELEEQNERLKQYGHTVAHDLRNPLTLLLGELDRLQSTAERADGGLDPGTVQRRCDTIGEVVERMEALIDDLLHMAEQGRPVLDPETVSLETTARNAWHQLESATAELIAEDTVVRADPDRLRELLSNLFRNAIEHGGSDVRVRTGPLDFDEGFFVEDDGPGIPPDRRDRVLERGFTTDEDGTGFGLAIVEQIAHAHDWTVSVTEGREGGARFEFRVE